MISNEEDTDGRARVTADEERVLSGVTMGWLLRLVTGAPTGKGAPDSFRVLND